MRLTTLIIFISLTHFASLLLLSNAIAIPLNAFPTSNALDTTSTRSSSQSQSQSLSPRGADSSTTPAAGTAANDEGGGGGGKGKGKKPILKTPGFVKKLFSGGKDNNDAKANVPIDYSNWTNEQLKELIDPLRMELASDHVETISLLKLGTKDWQNKTLTLFRAKAESLAEWRRGETHLVKFDHETDETIGQVKEVMTLPKAKGINAQLQEILNNLRKIKEASWAADQATRDQLRSSNRGRVKGEGSSGKSN